MTRLLMMLTAFVCVLDEAPVWCWALLAAAVLGGHMLLSQVEQPR